MTRFIAFRNYDPPSVIRQSGITELLPDLVLRFSGDPGERRIADIWLHANTNITSRLFGGGTTEATLSLATGRCVTSVPTLGKGFRGIVAAVNAIAFLHVPLHELRLLDTADRNLRISNVRVNAAQVSLSSTLMLPHIVVAVSISGTPLTQSRMSMARILPTLTFHASPLDQPMYMHVLEPEQRGDLTTKGDGRFSGRLSALLTFSGKLAEYEPMGERTRLCVRFYFVPNGISLFVTTQQVSSAPSTLSATLTKADRSGNGRFQREDSDGYVVINDQPLALCGLESSSGAAHAVWELEGVAADDIEVVNLGLLVAYEGKPRVADPLRVYGSLAPLSTINTADSTASIPRFVDASTECVLPFL